MSASGYGDNDDNDDFGEVKAACTPPNPHWKSNFAILISSITNKKLHDCEPTKKNKEIYAYALNKMSRDELPPETKNDLSNAYGIWSKLNEDQQDEFEEYLKKPVPVNPDDFNKDPEHDSVVKQQCEEFYRRIISAFKTWNAEDQAEAQVQTDFAMIDKQRNDSNITRAIINSLKDARLGVWPPPKERLSIHHLKPTSTYDKYIPIRNGGSRKYLRRRFKKSKSKSKKSKPKSKFNSKSKSSRNSKSKSKSKTKRWQKK